MNSAELENLCAGWPGVASGIKWHGKGLNVEPEITYTRRPNGPWRKVRLSLVNPAGLVLVPPGLGLIEAGTVSSRPGRCPRRPGT